MARRSRRLWERLREYEEAGRREARYEGAFWGAVGAIVVVGPLFWWLGSVFGR